MRRTQMILGVVAVMAAMLVAFTAPALADDRDWNDHSDDFYWYDDVGFLGYGQTSYDQLCSPGLPEGIYVPGCIFSDPVEEDFDFDDEEVVFFLEEDVDFDDEDIDFDDDDDENHDNERESLRIIDRH